MGAKGASAATAADFQQGARARAGEKMSPLTNGAGESWIYTWKKMKLYLYLSPNPLLSLTHTHTHNFKWIKRAEL